MNTTDVVRGNPALFFYPQILLMVKKNTYGRSKQSGKIADTTEDTLQKLPCVFSCAYNGTHYAHLSESGERKVYYLYTFTGIRRGEGVGLTWDCVDFDRGTIRIYRQWQKHPNLGGKAVYGFEPLKNDKERTFKPATQVMEVLKKVRVQQNKWKLACGAGWRSEEDFVFTHDDGTPYNADCVFKYFKKVMVSLGLENTRLHDLRHTFATLSLQNGTDVKTVSASLGHATTAFTMDQYGHVTEAMQNDSAKRMETLISSL